MTRGTIAFEVLLVLSLGASAGQLKLDQYYDSGAVFQRGVKIPVADKGDWSQLGATREDVRAMCDLSGSPRRFVCCLSLSLWDPVGEPSVGNVI